jgi:enoyl-CoA hydratase/carnithine racemase
MEGGAFRVEEDRDRHIATVKLARAEAGNRLLTPEIRALGQAIRAAGSRPDVKVVLLRSDGEHFCLGRQADPPGKVPASALGVRGGVTEPILDLYADVRATPVPVLAVVQGEAKGFGCALVGQCDLAIASENACFSMPEMDGNLPPTLAISAVLGKVPPKRLLHLIYTRGRISAAEALSLGLLGEVVPRDGLDAAVERMVSKLVDRNRAALCAVKEYMGAASHLDAAAAARLAANILSVVLSSPPE